MCSRARALTHAPHPVPCSYSVFTVIPAKIMGDDPITIHLQVAIDNAKEDEKLPLAPWH